jgi:hypothetical protein
MLFGGRQEEEKGEADRADHASDRKPGADAGTAADEADAARAEAVHAVARLSPANEVAIDLRRCPMCHGRMRVISAIHEPDVANAILECLGMPTEVPGTARARDPTDDDDLGASTDDVEQKSVPTTLPGPHRARDGGRVPWSWSK